MQIHVNTTTGIWSIMGFLSEIWKCVPPLPFVNDPPFPRPKLSHASALMFCKVQSRRLGIRRSSSFSVQEPRNMHVWKKKSAKNNVNFMCLPFENFTPEEMFAAIFFCFSLYTEVAIIQHQSFFLLSLRWNGSNKAIHGKMSLRFRWPNASSEGVTQYPVRLYLYH